MRSIIIPCKGRLAHLKETLPALLAQVGQDDQIIVVDYDCPDGSGAWASTLGIETVDLENAPIFNLSHARNLGAAAADPDAEILVFLDADSIPQPGWLDAVSVPIALGDVGLVHCGPGSCGVRRSVFEHVNGYDESFEGWGDEAFDFWNRCEKVEPYTTYRRDLLKVIGHSDEERTKFYFEKNPKTNQNRSAAHRRKRHGKPVNPGGYGKKNFRAHPQGKFQD